MNLCSMVPVHLYFFPFSLPGFDMTPNYVDSNPTGIVVSPWCNCRGSGNMEEECEKFLRDFTENPCLRKSEKMFPCLYVPSVLYPAYISATWEGT